jgi:hypothetical protein
MITLRKRGKKFSADLNCDNVRIRGPLKTRSSDVARRLVHRLESAIAEGQGSPLWVELQEQFPPSTFRRFAEHAGVKPRQLPTWDALKAAFKLHREQRVKLAKLAQSTSDRYEVTVREFGEFLIVEGVSLLQDVTKPLVERFKVWRVDRINKAEVLARWHRPCTRRGHSSSDIFIRSGK